MSGPGSGRLGETIFPLRGMTAGTIFAATKLPLTQWYRGMYHMTQTKQGISSLELARRLGVQQNTAWLMKQKLAQVMLEREDKKAARRTY